MSNPSKDAWPALSQHQLEILTSVANALIVALNPSGFPHRYAVAVVVGPIAASGTEHKQKIPVAVNSNLNLLADRKNLLAYAAEALQALIDAEAPGAVPADEAPGRLN